MFVAVGSVSGSFQGGRYTGSSVILTSPDGINWYSQSITDVNWLSGVAYGNGQFVATGQNSDPVLEYDNVALTSPDGVHWTETNVASGYWFGGVTYGDGLFAAVAGIRDTTVILTSEDGSNWNQLDFDQLPAYGVAYGSNGFLTVELTGGTLASTNGNNWSPNAIAGDYDTFGIGYGNGLYVAVGQSNSAYGAILTSPDGVTWTPHVPATTNLDGVSLYGAAWGVGQYVVAGTGGTILSSSDGVTWTVRNSGTSAGLASVAYGNGSFVAVGDVVLTSGQYSNAVLQISPPPTKGPLPMLLVAPSGHKYVVQSSTNLLDWATLSLLTNADGSVSFQDNFWTNYPARFYRTLLSSP
jgi:hypothetical protein